MSVDNRDNRVVAEIANIQDSLEQGQLLKDGVSAEIVEAQSEITERVQAVQNAIKDGSQYLSPEQKSITAQVIAEAKAMAEKLPGGIDEQIWKQLEKFLGDTAQLRSGLQSAVWAMELEGLRRLVDAQDIEKKALKQVLVETYKSLQLKGGFTQEDINYAVNTALDEIKTQNNAFKAAYEDAQKDLIKYLGDQNADYESTKESIISPLEGIQDPLLKDIAQEIKKGMLAELAQAKILKEKIGQLEGQLQNSGISDAERLSLTAEISQLKNELIVESALRNRDVRALKVENELLNDAVVNAEVRAEELEAAKVQAETGKAEADRLKGEAEAAKLVAEQQARDAEIARGAANDRADQAETERDTERGFKEAAENARNQAKDAIQKFQGLRDGVVNNLKTDLNQIKRQGLERIRGNLQDPNQVKGALNELSQILGAGNELGTKVSSIQNGLSELFADEADKKTLKSFVTEIISFINQALDPIGIEAQSKKIAELEGQLQVEKERADRAEENLENIEEAIKGFDPVIVQMQELIKKFDRPRWDRMVAQNTPLARFQLEDIDMARVFRDPGYKRTIAVLNAYNPQRTPRAVNSNRPAHWSDRYYELPAAANGGAVMPRQWGLINRSRGRADQIGLWNSAETGEESSQNPASLRKALKGRLLRVINRDKEDDEAVAMRWLEENRGNFNGEMTELLVNAVRGNLDALRNENDVNRLDEIRSMLQETQRRGSFSRQGHEHIVAALQEVNRTRESADRVADQQIRLSFPDNLSHFTLDPSFKKKNRRALSGIKVWKLFGNGAISKNTATVQGDINVLAAYSRDGDSRRFYKVKYRNQEYFAIE